MANRYSNRSDRDRDRNRNRGEKFGGTRERNENESNRGGQSGGGYNANFGSSYSPGQSHGSGQSFGGNWGRGDFDRIGFGMRYGSASYRDFGQSDRERERAWLGRADVGRDFMTNQPIFENYGQMDDRDRQSSFGRRSSGDYGRESLYSEPNRDFSERGGYSGGSYGNYETGFENPEDYEYSGRTEFDESIAGRPYYGTSGRGYYREGWRGYGTRPGNLGYGDRERPDQWNRDAYGAGGFNSGQRSPYYTAAEYGEDNPRIRDSWNWNRIDSGRDRYRRHEESFGDKVKNFFGMGPKNYKRSDDRIREDISERLEDHPDVDASNIEVVVTEGVVTLSGTVDDRRAKRLAEDTTDNVRGVKDVNNHIRVQQYGLSESGRTGSSLGDVTSPSSTTSSTKKGSERAA